MMKQSFHSGSCYSGGNCGCNNQHRGCCCPIVPNTQNHSFCFNITSCNGGAPIPGAAVHLEDITCNSGESKVTDNNGKVCFNLKRGHKYSIYEESAPSGYMPDLRQHSLCIDNRGRICIDGCPKESYKICNLSTLPALFFVTYNANGGTGGTTIPNLPLGSSHVVLSNTQAGVSFSGNTFVSWNTKPDGSGTTYLPGANLPITGNIVLYAQWQVIPGILYSVTYDPNGGGGGTTEGGIQPGTSYTILNETEAGVYRLDGYEFVSWNTAADGSGTTYLPGERITVTSNVTLYAQWQEIPPEVFSLTYNANGGTGGMVISNLPSGAIYPVDTPAQAGVENIGFDFVSWNTMPDGSGTTYLPGDDILMLQDVTLYAQWI